MEFFVIPHRYRLSLKPEGDMTTVIYIVLIWFLFNIVFAAAMYFRPRRSSSRGSERSGTAEQGWILPRSPGTVSAESKTSRLEKLKSAPAYLKFLFFGLLVR
jgi:hypothetical protein